MQKLEYIHLNPVRAGIVSIAEAYRYSSAAYYYTGKSDGVSYRIMMADLAYAA